MTRVVARTPTVGGAWAVSDKVGRAQESADGQARGRIGFPAAHGWRMRI